jgi:hypothetical protein
MEVRKRVVNLLRKALRIAKEGQHLVRVGKLAIKVSEATGAQPKIAQLIEETRNKGFVAEADILTLALAVAVEVEQPGELYEHALISIHELACECLDALHDARKTSSGKPFGLLN